MNTNKEKIRTVKAVITTLKSNIGYGLGHFSIEELNKAEFNIHCNIGKDIAFYSTDIVALIEPTALSSYLRVIDGEIVLRVYVTLNHEE